MQKNDHDTDTFLELSHFNYILEIVIKLQEKLSAMIQESIATKPPELIGPLLTETEKLALSGIVVNAIKVGETLPDFTLSDEKGIAFA